jgi:predicted nucleic acid-binding protein
VGWVENLSGKTVGLDTGPLIYYIERKPGYVEILRPFFQSVDRGEISVVTSIITLLEVLVQPIRLGDQYLALQYRKMLFGTRGLTTILLSSDIAEEAAKLRADYKSVRTPDAIQMATAISMSAPFFLTNDIRLPSLPGLQTLCLEKIKTELSS